MPYVVSDSGSALDPGPNSSQFPPVPPDGAIPESEPDRVVAYLRSVINVSEPVQAAAEPGFLGRFRRKRKAESPLGVRATLAPKAPTPAEPPSNPEPEALAPPAIEAAIPEPETRTPVVAEAAAPELEVLAPVVAEASAPQPSIPENHAEPMQAVFLEEPPLVSAIDEEPRCEVAPVDLPAPQAEPDQIPELEATLSSVREEPGIPENIEQPAIFEAAAVAPAPPAAAAAEPVPELISEPVIEAILEPAPAPVTAAPVEPICEFASDPVAAVPVEPVSPEPVPRPMALRGEVLPPEAFAAGSPERRRPAEPTRVITMQPGTRRASGETPRSQSS